MIIAIDVHYRQDKTKVVALSFDKWSDQMPKSCIEIFTEEAEEYIPGEFYKRELPAVLKVLDHFDLNTVETIIVDSYVQLDDQGKAGMGMHLYEALDQKIPIVGVAKKGFKDNEKYVLKVLRGKSEKPLFITTIGLALDDTALRVKNMAGKYRMPDLLRILDQKTKAD